MSFVAQLNKLWTFGDEIGAVQKGSQSNAVNSTTIVVLLPFSYPFRYPTLFENFFFCVQE